MRDRVERSWASEARGNFFLCVHTLSIDPHTESLHTLPHTMPVAVAAPATPASTSKIGQKARPEDVSFAEASPMTKKSRKRTRNVGKEPQVEVPSAGTSQAAEDEPWSWQSLTDSSASRVAPFFTKDGKCVGFRHEGVAQTDVLCAATFSALLTPPSKYTLSPQEKSFQP